MTRVATPPTKPGILHSRPCPTRSRPATAVALLVFFSAIPIADTSFVTGRMSKAPVNVVLSRPRVEHSPSEAFHLRSYDTRLHRKIPVNSDVDMEDDWRALKQSVKNIAKKAGKKLKSAAKKGGKKLLEYISPAEQEKLDLIDESLPRKSSLSTSAERETYDAANRELDVLGRGGLSDLFFGVPNYFSPGGPLASSLFGGRDGGLLATEDFADQEKMVDDVLVMALAALVDDPDTKSLLGEPVMMDRPFSQESSTTTVNGNMKSTVEAKFGVRGPKGAGTAFLTATDGMMDSLTLELDGWTHDINVQRGRLGERDFAKQRKGSGDVIDVEVVKEML